MKKIVISFTILAAVATTVVAGKHSSTIDSLVEANVEALARNEFGKDYYADARNQYCNDGRIGCVEDHGRTCTLGIFCNQ